MFPSERPDWIPPPQRPCWESVWGFNGLFDERSPKVHGFDPHLLPNGAGDIGYRGSTKVEVSDWNEVPPLQLFAEYLSSKSPHKFCQEGSDNLSYRNSSWAADLFMLESLIPG